MNYWQVMRLPIRVFWMMSVNVGKILAEKDLRQLTIVGSQTTEGMSSLRNHLVVEMEGAKGSERNDERDQEGVEELKALATLMQ